VNLVQTVCDVENWINLAQVRWWVLVNTAIDFHVSEKQLNTFKQFSDY
jgi:hypothetical protein